jgi:hypothetical protein
MHQESKQKYRAHLIWLNIATRVSFPDKTFVELRASGSHKIKFRCGYGWGYIGLSLEELMVVFISAMKTTRS